MNIIKKDMKTTIKKIKLKNQRSTYPHDSSHPFLLITCDRSYENYK